MYSLDIFRNAQWMS